MVLARILLPITVVALWCASCAAQDSVSVSVAPDTIVRAGESLNLTVTLDKAPTFAGRIHVYAQGPNPEQGVSAEAPVMPQAKVIPLAVTIPPTASGGQWQVKAVMFWTGFQWQQLAMKEIAFRVIANEGVVFPAKAEVAVNPSQVQLFRRAALNLQSRIQGLKASVSQSGDKGELAADVIRKEIKDAMGSLDATESDFRKLASGAGNVESARVFFSDLRLSYEEALTELARRHATSAFQTALVPVAFISSPQAANPQNHILLQTALRPLEQNELAYTKVADAASLTFDLTVRSNPAGAAISYRRRGDTYRQNPESTNTVIPSLPYAIWILKIEKSGYKTEEREHDPFREPNHVLNVDLKP